MGAEGAGYASLKERAGVGRARGAGCADSGRVAGVAVACLAVGCVMGLLISWRVACVRRGQDFYHAMTELR